MNESTASTVLSPGFRANIASTAEQLTETFPEIPPETDPLIFYADAVDKLGVTEVTVRKWHASGFIPSEKVGTRTAFRFSTIEQIAELRETHGRDWFHFVPWEAGEQRMPPKAFTIAGHQPDDTPPDDGDVTIGHYKRAMELAKEAHENGRFEGASHLFIFASELITVGET